MYFQEVSVDVVVGAVGNYVCNSCNVGYCRCFATLTGTVVPFDFLILMFDICADGIKSEIMTITRCYVLKLIFL